MSISISVQVPNVLLSCHTIILSRVSPLSTNLRIICPRTRRCGSLHKTLVRAGLNQSASSKASSLQIPTAAEVVREFYDGINRRDLAAVDLLIGEGCVYEDLVFSHPFVGRKATLEFFKKFSESISKDLQFVIDDISNEDSLAVGVTWHLEWKGRPFPFSKGCSFYRLAVLDGRKQIIYGRDCVEPATKPGETALDGQNKMCLLQPYDMEPCTKTYFRKPIELILETVLHFLVVYTEKALSRLVEHCDDAMIATYRTVRRY